MRDFLTGTKKERTALERIQKLETKRHLSEREKEILRELQGTARRLRRRQIVVGGAAFFVSAGAAVAISRPIRGESDEEAYGKYLTSFEELARGDDEAEGYRKFFKERARRARMRGTAVFAEEEGHTKDNFWVAMVDPRRHREAYRTMSGFASFEHRAKATYLLLRKVPIDPVWSGALIAHEALHIYQILTGIEQEREDGFIIGELEAYELEFRLLDRVTGGGFRTVLSNIAAEIEPGKYRGRLSANNIRSLEALFDPPRSEDEVELRSAAYLIAVNFVSFEIRSESLAEAREEKTNYARGIFEGRTRMLR